MLPTENTFDNANKNELIVITIAKICTGKRKKKSKHKLEFMGPFIITKINDNGMVCFQKGIINDATNTPRIKPLFD